MVRRRNSQRLPIAEEEALLIEHVNILRRARVAQSV
jgi:hypothetical protein